VNGPRARWPRIGLAGAFLRIFAGLMVVWLLAPILVVIPLSFTGKKSFEFPPTSWSTEWYHQLFTAPEWVESLTHSVVIALFVVLLAGVLGTACAVGLDRGVLPGKAIVRGLVLSPIIVPVVIVAVGVYLVFLPWHLAGHELGFVLAHTALAIPFVVISVSTSLAGFDRRLEQAAASLGSSPWSTFLHVTLPAIAPGIFAGAVLAFITSFDEVVTALFLSTPTIKTLPVQMFQTINNVDPTIAAASTLVLAGTTLIMLVVLIFNRDVRSGR
jgi:putative spermidine/putrescine transport system permease protein